MQGLEASSWSSRWTQLLAGEQTDAAWGRHVVEVSQSILPAARSAWLHVIEFDGNDRAKRHRLTFPAEYGDVMEQAIAQRQRRCPAGLTLPSRPRAGDSEATLLQLVAQPTENVNTCVLWHFDEPPIIQRAERQLLERLAFHLDAAQRIRERPETVVAILSDRGRIDYLRDGAPDVWPALLDGRVSIVARSASAREEYLVIENTRTTRAARALSLAESATLRLASQGMSNKLMAYGLGISSTAVSRHLSSATSKLGLASRAELIRVAALLVQDTHDEAADGNLTSAEREILVHLQRGLSNQEIANLRGRSVRTIANQVASLLRKTGSGSRRELTVRRGIDRLSDVPDVAE